MRLKRIVVIVFGTLLMNAAIAQQADTLSLSISQCQKIFNDQNLQLLSKQYDINIAKAQLIQARIIDNPSIYIEQNIFNSNNQKYFDVGYSGENIFQAKQLIHLAGQRNKRVNIQKINKEISEYQFYDLLRTLNFQLKSSFYRIHFLLKSIDTYNYQLITFSSLQKALQNQYDKGNISLKELMRIKAVVFALQNEKLGFLNQVNNEQNNIKVLLGNKQTTFIKPLIDNSSLSVKQLPFALKQLIDTAYANRADAKISESYIRLGQADLKYQRSLGLPDASIGYVYDRQGSFIRDYSAISLGIDLPVFNRNQGNIALSKAKLEQSKKQNELYGLQLENDVQQIWSKTILTDSLYRSFDSDFQPNFEKVMQGMIDNYQRRNISLIEFLDYYDTYKQNIIQYNELNTQRLNTFEELNFTVGKDLIK